MIHIKKVLILDLENANLKEPDISDLLEYLSNNHQVTQLKLAGKYINDGIIQNLVNSSNIQNLTDINFINCIYITDKGIEALANSPNMQNLTSINFQYCYKITNKGIEALADSQNIQNLSSISFEDCYKITDKGVESLVNSPNMQNLTSINLGGCNITDKALTDLTNSSNMQNITSINFRGTIITDKALMDLANSLNMQNITNINFKDCNDITNKGITDLVNSSSTKNLTIISLSTLMSIEEIEDIVKKLPKIQELKIADDNGLSEFCNYLIQLRDFESNSDFNKEERIKDIMFSFAQQGKDEYIKYILNNQEKYPFLVNTKDEYDHNLMHFYTHDPEMQKLFFEKGMIPSKEIDPDNIMLSIVNDAQSVHTSEVTKRTNFFTNELVQVFSDNYIKLTEEAEKYKSEVKDLFSKNLDLAIDLLDLTAQEKESVMEKTLRGNTLPSDKEFIKIVIDKAFKVLNENYLRKDSNGEYDEGYPTERMQYDWTKDAEKKITIPQSIGLISKLASETKPNFKQIKELTITLLTKKQGKNRAEIYDNLKSLNENEVKALFNKESGLDIEKVYKEQQKFKLAKQLYVAATNYGYDSSSCIQGTWVQIITTAEEIKPELSDDWGKYKETQREGEAQKNNITEENIKPFLDALAKDELSKKDSTIIANENLKDLLQESILGMQDLPINTPEKLSKEEEKILSVINTYFSKHIKEHLSNYDKIEPTFEEYKTLINTMPQSGEMQKFALNPDIYAGTSNKPNIEVNNKESGKTTHQDRLQAQREQLRQPQGRGI